MSFNYFPATNDLVTSKTQVPPNVGNKLSPIQLFDEPLTAAKAIEFEVANNILNDENQNVFVEKKLHLNTQ
jgi:hypothetical protein